MIIEITKPLEIKLEKEKVQLPTELKEKIERFWKDLIKEHPNFWDGENICVNKFEKLEDKQVLFCKKTKYSHYLYDERIGIKDKKYCGVCLWGGILLKTKDNYFLLGEMAETTSTPLCIETCGGGADEQDIDGDNINIIKTIERELKEELNLQLNNSSQITKYEIKYLEIPEGKRHAYGVLAVGNLNMTKEQMEEHYKKYLKYLKENQLEIEFKSMKFLPITNAKEILENMQNPKRDYLFELLEKEEKS